MRSASTATRLSAVLLAVAIGPCSALFAQSYEIRLERPEKVGRKSKITVSARRTMSVTSQDVGAPTPVMSEDLLVEAEGVQTVLAVNAAGAPASLSVRFDKLNREQGGAFKPLLPKGSVVTASSEGNTVAFTMDGKPVSRELTLALALLRLLPLRPGAANADDLFGTTERKRVGDLWPVDAERCVKDFQDTGISFARASVVGNATLEGTASVGDQKCLMVSADVTASGFVPPNLPQGTRLLDSTCRITMARTVPVDAALPPLEGSAKMEVMILTRGRLTTAAPETTIEQRLEMGRKFKRTEVK